MTTSLMKFKEVCHYTYHNLYDGNSGTKKVFFTQQTQKEAWIDKLDTKL